MQAADHQPSATHSQVARRERCVSSMAPGAGPSKQILCASYGQDLADKHARDCRTLVSSAFYRSLFPRTALSPEKKAVEDFMTTKQGFRLSVSVGGPITGRGADIIIVDDPLKPEDALSEAQRKKTNDWYFNTLLSRLNSKADGAIVLVMQRLAFTNWFQLRFLRTEPPLPRLTAVLRLPAPCWVACSWAESEPLSAACSGCSRTTTRIREIALKIIVDDQLLPVHKICFFKAPAPKGLNSEHPLRQERRKTRSPASTRICSPHCGSVLPRRLRLHVSGLLSKMLRRSSIALFCSKRAASCPLLCSKCSTGNCRNLAVVRLIKGFSKHRAIWLLGYRDSARRRLSARLGLLAALLN